MEKTTRLRIALIGLGDIARKAYLPIMANHALVDPVLCTRDRNVLEQLSAIYRIDSCYHNIDDLLKADLDAAMVHSSTNSHFHIARKLLKAGVPTFVDKPLSLSLKETEELLNLASQNKVNLYVGLNRRFAPLVNALAQQQNPIHITWKKNRVSQPADAREFILNDFIHVVDGLRFLGKGKVKDLQVFTRKNNELLESIQVQWRQNEILLTGTMNRVSGLTEERIEFYTPGNTWLLEGLHVGWHHHKGTSKELGFDHWESTLAKRGFVDMLEDWLGVLQDKKFDAARIEDLWQTHQLCEQIWQQTSQKKQE